MTESPGTIVVLGRFPPAQGGTATATLALVSKLRHSGWDVEVVTNRPASKHDYIQFLNGDQERLAALCKLTVVGSDESSRPVVSNPGRVQAVVSTYLAPYAALGASLSLELSVPHVACHAGSDLRKLTSKGGAEIIAALSSCARIISNRNCAPLLRSVGLTNVSDDVIPYNWWQEDHQTFLPFTNLFEQILGTAAGCQSALRCAETCLAGSKSEELRLGIIGKVDLSAEGPKQHYKILHAIRKVVRQGRKVTLLAVIGGDGLQRFVTEIAQLGLAQSSIVLPYLMPWHIPSALSHCHVVACLENEFWVPEHNSQQPLEIMAAGSCGMFSTRIARRLEAAGLSGVQPAFLVPRDTDVKSIASALLSCAPPEFERRGRVAKKAITSLRRRIKSWAPVRPDDVIRHAIECKAADA